MPDFLEIAERILLQPTAPYFEQGVATVIVQIAREIGLTPRSDRAGNLILEYRQGAADRPLALMAHMDHPGFRIDSKIAEDRFAATFRGTVGEEYFQAGTRVLLMPGRVPATLEGGKTNCQLRALAPVAEPPAFAVWDLVDFLVDGAMLRARACDDLIGVASILSVLAELQQTQANAHVLGILTRAEEVGFHGALRAVRDGVIPKSALVISLETSKELPPVRQGEGVIIRVGDRSSIFDSWAIRYLTEIAADRAKSSPNFKFQKALMSGGTCEATPLLEAGYQTGAVCIALGNYHNCGLGNRVGAESVSIDDARSMVALLVDAAKRLPEFQALTGRLNERLKSLETEAESLSLEQMPSI